MPNNVINKVVYGDRTLIDLTDTTADAADVASGKYFYAKDGVKTLGTGSIGSDNGDVYQDEEGYIVLKPGAGTNVSVTPLSVTENGTYSAPTGVAYSPVSVDVEQGAILPTYTVYWDSDTGELDHVICDMTYTEIMAIMGDNNYCDCFIKESQDDYGRTFGATCSYDPYSDDHKIVINVMSPNGVPYFVIHHFPNDTKTISLWDYNDSSDMYVLDNYIYAKSGYYLYDEGISMPSAPQATPTIAFSSNGLITATAVQTSGYVSAGTKTSTYSLTTRSAADMTVNGSYVTAPSGYYSEAFSKAVSAGSAKIASYDFTYTDTINYNSSLGTVYTISYSYTFNLSATTNGFRSGYFSSKTDIINSSFPIRVESSTIQLPSLAATTYTPTTTAQYISSYQWLTGSQTILGDADLVPSNIRSGVSIFNVEGTMTEGPDVIEVWPETSFTLDATGKAVLPESMKMIPPVGRGIEATVDNVLHHVLMVQREDDDDHSNFTYRLYSEEAKTNLLYISFNENLITSSSLTANSTHTIKLEYHLSIEKETLAVLTTNQTVSIPFSEFGEYYLTTPTTNTEISVFSGCELELTINGETHIVGFGDFWVEYATCEVSEANLISSSGTTYAQVKLSKLSTPCTLTYSASIIKYDELVAPHGTIYVPLGKTIDTTYIKYARAESPYLQYKSVTPSSETQIITADSGYDGLDEVWVNGDSNLVASNIKSGVSIFGVTGTVSDENDLPTIYGTWDDNIGEYGGYVYSCNYTYSQMISMLTALDGNPLVGEFHDVWDNDGTIIITRNGGNWIIDSNTNDPVFKTLYNGAVGYRYFSDGSFEQIPLVQNKNVTPSRNTQYVYPDYPYEYLYGVGVSGDSNLLSSNIRSGVSIFGVEGTYVTPDTAGIFIERMNTTVSVYSNSTVSRIGTYAFAGGISIYSINFPNVTLIDDYAFYSNARTSNYSLPNVVSVGNSAFYGAWIRNINLPECTYVGSNAFTFCSSVNSINMPKLVTANTGAFAYGLYYLGQNSTIEFPELILSNVDQRVFAGCRMYSISLPKCSIIPSGTFSGCSYLQSAYIPECTSIGPYAFHNCSSYGFSYVEYSKCTIIYDSAFYSCKSLTGISFPEVLSIGNHAFGNCIKLESVYAPKCISLGIGAFNSCSLLSEINLPSLETLGGFQYCTNLTSINFQNVTSTTGNVFMGCSNLSVAILPKLSIVTSDIFAYTTSILATYNLHTLYLSDCNYIYSYAFRYCMSLSSLYLLGSSIITLNHTNAFTSTPISTMASTTTFNIEAVTASIPPRNIIWTPAATFASSLRGSPTVFSIYYDVSSAGNYSYDATVLVLAFNNDGVWTETNWVGGSGTKANDDHWANFLPAYSGTKTINITQIPLSASQVRFGLYNNGAIFSCSMASLSAIARVSTFGSIFVPASLYASYKAATNWTTYSSRFVSMTDTEIETFLSTLT